MRHIGLFGGTFNPVHNGHLLAAQAVLEQLNLDEVRFLPASHSPFKDKPELDDRHRMAMLERALAPYPLFSIDQRELITQGPSYTINTLRQILCEQGENQFYLLVGMDAWEHFESWREWQSIMQLCHLVIMTRPGYTPARLTEYWQEKLENDLDEVRSTQAGNLIFLSVPASDAASSDIRQGISRGQPLRGVLADPVLEYIQQEGLYQDKI